MIEWEKAKIKTRGADALKLMQRSRRLGDKRHHSSVRKINKNMNYRKKMKLKNCKPSIQNKKKKIRQRK